MRASLDPVVGVLALVGFLQELGLAAAAYGSPSPVDADRFHPAPHRRLGGLR